MKAKLLYVEDDESLSFVTRDNLQLQGYDIVCRNNGKDALKTIQEDSFDLCILDVMLPEIDGFTVAKEIRKKDQHVPIIFLTAKSLKEDKIKGLKLGGDDYITKPFSIEELLLKVDIFLRRSRITGPKDQQMHQLGEYTFDYGNLSLFRNNNDRRLTQREAELLKMLVEHKNQVLKREDILENIWGKNDYFLGRSLDVFISRLRKYLKADDQIKIENIHGVGFRLQIAKDALRHS